MGRDPPFTPKIVIPGWTSGGVRVLPRRTHIYKPEGQFQADLFGSESCGMESLQWPVLKWIDLLQIYIKFYVMVELTSTQKIPFIQYNPLNLV